MLRQNIKKNYGDAGTTKMTKLVDNIAKVRRSIIAIGFRPSPNKVTIVGSGFSVGSDGKILSSMHLYNQLTPEQRKSLVGMVMVKRDDKLEHYRWFPLKLVKKNDKADLVLFQLDEYKDTLLQPLKIGDSDKLEVGQEVYFIGFPYAAQLINEGFGITLVVNRAIVSNIKHDGRDPAHERNFLILDAISNPGNSGCPLIDVETNKVVGVMAIAFRTKSRAVKDLDIREPMHICAAKPINLIKKLGL